MPKDFFEENRTKIEKISKKLKNKKVIIYGTGKLFQFLKSENVFSDWDVVGVCDNKYLPEDENLECEGYRIINHDNLNNYKADYIFISVQKYRPVLNRLKKSELNAKIISLENDLNLPAWLKRIIYRKTNTFVYVKSDGRKVFNPKIKNLKVKFYGKNNYVEIHEPVAISEKMYISCYSGCRIMIRENNLIKSLAVYSGNNTDLEIGKNNSIEDVIISLKNASKTKLTIGSNCMLSYGIFLRTSDGHAIYDTRTRQMLNKPADIVIGNHVWISADCKILKGVTVPDNCIIGTNSVVTKKFTEENCIIAGNPAGVLKRDVNWIKNPTLI